MKLTIIVLSLLLASALIYAGGYEVPLTKGFADTLYCQLKGVCDIANLTVGSLTLINGTVNFLNVTIINYNVTGEVNVEGDVIATNFFGIYDWIILNDLSRTYLFFNGTDEGFNETTLNATIKDLTRTITYMRPI